AHVPTDHLGGLRLPRGLALVFLADARGTPRPEKVRAGPTAPGTSRDPPSPAILSLLRGVRRLLGIRVELLRTVLSHLHVRAAKLFRLPSRPAGDAGGPRWHRVASGL